MKTFLFLILFLSLVSVPVFAHCPLCSAATGMAVATARFYGVSDLITGTLVGVFVISTGLWTNNMLKKRNKGRAYFSLQMPVVLAISFVMTIITFYFAGLLHVDKLFTGLVTGNVVSLLAFWTHNELRKDNHNKNYLPFQGLLLPLIFITALNITFYAGGLL